ncbi:trypsin-like serine peptidase [Listeria booriae]|uniref:trypsin-like serine peptidase n=1 Tax=Listeria booriae TaxID=1552123 RepID=UPI00163DE4B5|nr:trypsin-like peptidase domain-containing protein [Listeria booriae]MBC1307186.1 trypsin-like serine protease [Listeria booriae]
MKNLIFIIVSALFLLPFQSNVMADEAPTNSMQEDPFEKVEASTQNVEIPIETNNAENQNNSEGKTARELFIKSYNEQNPDEKIDSSDIISGGIAVTPSKSLLKSIVGTDTRVKVNPKVSPYNKVCSLYMYYSYGNKFKEFVGTGFAINSTTIATAAHCIYSKADSGWANGVVASFGLNGYGNQILTAGNKSLTVPTKYTSTGQWQYDYGYIKTNKSISAVRSLTMTTPMGTNMDVTITGYPGEKSGYQYKSSGNATISTNRLAYNIDTTGGQSGSPILDKSNQVVGIHNYGINEVTGLNNAMNTGTKLTPAIINFFK